MIVVMLVVHAHVGPIVPAMVLDILRGIDTHWGVLTHTALNPRSVGLGK